MVEVITTKKFKESFVAENNFNRFIQNFKEWKELQALGEDSISFGKDGGYREPKLSSGYLMHVHTKPSTKIELDRWQDNFDNNRERRSDKALVYVQRGNKYLLIDWLRENAHNETDYTPHGKALLQKYAQIAEKFINHEEQTITEKMTFKKFIIK